MNQDDLVKAGHAPAEMVGGRRIVSKKDRKLSDSNNDSANSESSDEQLVKEIIDGNLPAKMEKSYPTISVKKAHEKPVPALQKEARIPRQNNIPHCHQPRKETH